MAVVGAAEARHLQAGLNAGEGSPWTSVGQPEALPQQWLLSTPQELARVTAIASFFHSV